MNWFQTFTGRVIDLDAHPKTWPIAIEDIAHALSLICRWSGHVKAFYSVAQHSVTMSCQVEDLQKHPERGLALLLHDASEAYLNDVISPLKRRVREGGRPSRYDVLESKCQEAIATKFGLPVDAFAAPEVKHLDLRMLMTEYRDLIPPFAGGAGELPDTVTGWAKSMPEPFKSIIVPKGPHEAKELFLIQFHDLMKYRKNREEKR